MTRTLAIAQRELGTFFGTPVGFVVLAAYLFASGFIFGEIVLRAGAAAEMRPFFNLSVYMLVFVAPAISMRMLAEEMRTGTLEPLLTCPVREIEVVAGKWLGAMAFFGLMLVPTLVYVLVLEVHGDPDYGPIVGGYFGLVLVGGLYLALGLLASSIWASQILAYLMALFFWMVFAGLTELLPLQLRGARWEPLADALAWMSVAGRFQDDFGKGVLDTSSIAYLVSGIVLFLAVTVKIVESRRWR